MSSRATNIDSSTIVHLHTQLIAEQDEELEKLSETISNTNNLAWAIREELRLLDGLSGDVNKYVEVRDSRLQRAERRVAILSNGTSSSCGCSSCLCLLFFSITMLAMAMAALIYALIKYF